ncbi:MAG TPA: restriction endonuclease [Kofleriaceae bacterium]|nr:restriction endonuclease [Kofleriaceae bacterium]
MVPDFQSLTRPTFEVLAGDGGELSLAIVRIRVAERIGLTEAQTSELLPSGGQPRFNNRVNWAAIYLTAAGLLRWVRRGVYQATDRGHQTLPTAPERMDIAFLSQFPEFVAWRKKGSTESEAEEDDETPPANEVTPEEQIEIGHQMLRRRVELQLLDKLMAASPLFFERTVVQLLVAMGYGGSLKDAGQALGRSGDGGIDGMIKEDRLGLDAIYVQAKRWDRSRTIGRPDIQAFAGSLEGERARKGVFITTALFSREASDYVKRIEKKIVLVDGDMLASLMFEHNVGIRSKQTYELKEVDDDYFLDD